MMEIGDHVRRTGDDICGIVIEKEGGRAQVQWGTKTMHEGRPGMVMADWVPDEDLEAYPHKIVTADEIAERTKRQRDEEIRGARG